MTVSFFVAGTPKPQGSKRAFMPKGGKRPVMLESAGEPLKDWRASVAQIAACQDKTFTGPVDVRLVFHLVRPKSHYGSGRNAGTLKPSAASHHVQKPDIDKLTRAVLDALTGVLINDDSQVCGLLVRKRWQPRGLHGGCSIEIAEAE